MPNTMVEHVCVPTEFAVQCSAAFAAFSPSELPNIPAYPSGFDSARYCGVITAAMIAVPTQGSTFNFLAPL